MQSHLVHYLVHDECCPCHVAGILHEGYEEVKNQDLWQEHDDRTYTTNNSVGNHSLERSVGHVAAYGSSYPSHGSLNPVHGILAERECCLEHQPYHGYEDRKAEVSVCDNPVYEVRHLVCVLVLARSIRGLAQGTMNETVFSIHYGRLAVLLHFLLHSFCSQVSLVKYLLGVWQGVDEFLHIAVTLHKLNAKVSGRVALAYDGILLQIFLYA